LLEGGQRLVEPVLAEQRGSQLLPGLRHLGMQPQRLAVFEHRLGRPLQSHQRDALIMA
jgi:hypothetical protein